MKRIYITFAVAAVLLTSGCKKYLDVNTDPATPQNAESKTLTPPLFAQMERGVQFDSRYLGPLIQNWGSNAGGMTGEIHGWYAGSDVTGEIWRTVYYGLGGNLSLIMDDATATQQYNYLGLAQSLRAWAWQIGTDYHGDMILKQAFDAERYVYDYDAQPEVYAEVVRLANESIANFSRTDGTGTVAKIASADLVYKGDASKWIKFNYGLLARNLNNLVNKAAYDPAKVIEYVDKALSSNADNFIVPNNGSNSTDANFFGPLRANLGSYRQSRMIVGLLDGTYLAGNSGAVIDPRRSNMITASGDGVFRGVNPGEGDPNSGAANTNTTAVANPWGGLNSTNPGAGAGKFLNRDNAGFPIMTYAEMQFIKAEAALRNNNAALAHQAYLNGISAHIDFVSSLKPDISATAKAAYLAGDAVVQNPASLTLKHVMLQKYIALWGHGFVETWSDLRKYRYIKGDEKGNKPYLDVFQFPRNFFLDNSGEPAQRYRPRFNSEYLWNIAALKKIGGDQPNYHTYVMWFTQP